MRVLILALIVALVASACTLEEEGGTSSNDTNTDNGETGRVTRVIDGDTIEVDINGQIYDIRYIGMNTPERDESCYRDATEANRDLVEGETVRLVRDVSDTDRFDRLLRYVYVGDVFVNERLVEQGFAEVVRYTPDTSQFLNFRELEQAAARDNRGCHPTGIFDDNNYDR